MPPFKKNLSDLVKECMETKERWFLTNVVWYDGIFAYTSKFILKVTDTVTEESKKKVLRYLDGNGEVLKYDPQYAVTFDNIVAFGELEDATDEREKEKYAAYYRFKEMWF